MTTTRLYEIRCYGVHSAILDWNHMLDSDETLRALRVANGLMTIEHEIGHTRDHVRLTFISTHGSAGFSFTRVHDLEFVVVNFTLGHTRRVLDTIIVSVNGHRAKLTKDANANVQPVVAPVVESTPALSVDRPALPIYKIQCRGDVEASNNWMRAIGNDEYLRSVFESNGLTVSGWMPHPIVSLTFEQSAVAGYRTVVINGQNLCVVNYEPDRAIDVLSQLIKVVNDARKRADTSAIVEPVVPIAQVLTEERPEVSADPPKEQQPAISLYEIQCYGDHFAILDWNQKLNRDENLRACRIANGIMTSEHEIGRAYDHVRLTFVKRKNAEFSVGVVRGLRIVVVNYKPEHTREVLDAIIAAVNVNRAMASKPVVTADSTPKPVVPRCRIQCFGDDPLRQDFANAIELDEDLHAACIANGIAVYDGTPASARIVRAQALVVQVIFLTCKDAEFSITGESNLKFIVVNYNPVLARVLLDAVIAAVNAHYANASPVVTADPPKEPVVSSDRPEVPQPETSLYEIQCYGDDNSYYDWDMKIRSAGGLRDICVANGIALPESLTADTQTVKVQLKFLRRPRTEFNIEVRGLRIVVVNYKPEHTREVLDAIIAAVNVNRAMASKPVVTAVDTAVEPTTVAEKCQTIICAMMGAGFTDGKFAFDGTTARVSADCGSADPAKLASMIPADANASGEFSDGKITDIAITWKQ